MALSLSLSAMPVRFLAWDAEIVARKVSLKNGDKVEEIEGLALYNRTGYFSVSKAQEAKTHLITPDRLAKDGQPDSIELKFPEGIQNPLVILLPDSKASTGLRTFIIEDSPKGFAWGTTRFVNATSQPFFFRHENKTTAIGPSWNPVDVSIGGESRKMEVQLFTAEPPRKLCYSAVWGHDPDVRKLAIILPGSQSRTGKIDFRILPENRNTAASAAITNKL